MANLEFNNRFKNKLNTLGKTGFLQVDPTNAVNKQEVPERKMHKFSSILTSSQSITTVIGKKPNLLSQSPISSVVHGHFPGSYSNLPSLNPSPLKQRNTRDSNSKSPILIRYQFDLTQKHPANLANSYAKLPKIHKKISTQKFTLNK